MLDQYSPFPYDTLSPQLRFLFVLLLVWSIAWKLVSLWKSARHGQKIWFAVLFLVNSVGVLDLIYLGFFQKNTPNVITLVKERLALRNKTSHKR